MKWHTLRTQTKSLALEHLKTLSQTTIKNSNDSIARITFTRKQFEEVLALCWARTLEQVLKAIAVADTHDLDLILADWDEVVQGHFTEFDRRAIKASAQAYIDLIKTGSL